ncbi:antiterminator Q family protein [Pseudomonas lurida]|uniref:Antiterminator Q family protein n=1 Tax=Pseudomonas lurida TaxID=244566 RepID=A0ABY9FNH0_9PSED|nr:antiterminator Q family protein [Pseudomonas lurida]WLH04836.1 antiterminator Q family protein [Pseudomonas lurida]
MMIRKPAGRPLGDTEYLLEQWGWWRMDGVRISGFTSPTLALMRQAVAQPSASKSYCITDDLAIIIDNAVSKLSHRDQQMGDVIWLYFGAKWPMVRVGKYYGMSEGKARELVRAGTAWIDCVVYNLEKAA